MDLSYSNEQEALRDSAEKFLSERYVAISRATEGGAWRTFAELGWLGFPLPVEHGGSGGTLIDVAILTEALGRHLAREPYVPCVVLGGSLVEACGSAEQKSHLLTALAEGSLQLAVAHQEAGNSPSGGPTTSARAAGSGFSLAGRKTAVPEAATADAVLVTARGADGTTGVYRVAAGAAGMVVQAYATVDGRTAADIQFTDTPAERLGAEADRSEAIITALDRAVAASCSDMVGAMNAALSATVAYARLRKQFGQPIGANQVVKHRLVEMAVRCEEARSSALLAVVRCADGSAGTLRSRAVSSAKVKIAKAARAVCEDAVQLHGAMGVTEELEIGGYLKRAIAFEATYGTTKHHRTRYSALPA